MSDRIMFSTRIRADWTLPTWWLEVLALLPGCDHGVCLYTLPEAVPSLAVVVSPLRYPFAAPYEVVIWRA
jgi:hypothetical protein